MERFLGAITTVCMRPFVPGADREVIAPYKHLQMVSPSILHSYVSGKNATNIQGEDMSETVVMIISDCSRMAEVHELPNFNASSPFT